jgi:predicted dehydrogenase
MKKVKVGIVGIGSIAHMFHLSKYQSHPQVELTAVADMDYERAKAVAAGIPGATAYSNAEDMFVKAEIEAVSICTFNESHVALALLALEHGIDVLVEKPMAISTEQALQLKEKAEKTQNIVMVGMSHRYRDQLQILQGIAAAGELGEIYYAKAKVLRRRGAPIGWFTSHQYSGGGPVMDIGVHALDLAWWLMGTPTPDKVLGKMYRKIAPYQTKHVATYTASSSENKVNPVYDVEDLGTAFITFTNGASLTVEASWAINGDEDDSLKIELFGTKGGASLDPLTLFQERNQLGFESKPSYIENDYFEAEIAHFIDCVIHRKHPLSDVHQGYVVVQMLEAIMQSSEENDVVRL